MNNPNILEGKFTWWIGTCDKCGLGFGLHREVLTETPEGWTQAVLECPAKS